MVKTFFATKLTSSQSFDEAGKRLTVTRLKAVPLTVTQVKSLEPDGYEAVQLAVGSKSIKSIKRPQAKKLKAANLTNPPLWFREVRVETPSELKVGDQLKVDEVFAVGDQVKVSGTVKGRGFAGVVKRHGFHGGPKTHGQSDRHRAPGSIGMRTTPGRVWKGKRMAGRYGGYTATIKNLKVVSIDAKKELLTVTGTVPGATNSLVVITKL
ncbi:MAG TPA: 50S ribosomal protein L3 [Patescibacteria group bacterium]|nr:50S ribosomal protein L3 [Patescibacteria group bacterium]